MLGVSLGASAVFALLSLLRALTGPVSLAHSKATLNGSYAPGRPWLDLAFQLASVGSGVVPALLAVHLLRRGLPIGEVPAGTVAGGDVTAGTAPDRDGPVGRGLARLELPLIGLDRSRLQADLGWASLLAIGIGVPGLLLYLAAHALGMSATVVASGLPAVWWRIPVLVLSAVMNATLEEVVVVGYLLTRLGELGWRPRWALAASAVLRGGYHLYQGFGAFLGNAVMGLVFGTFFQRSRRVVPLIVAHALLDIVAFVGYTALHGRVSWLP